MVPAAVQSPQPLSLSHCWLGGGEGSSEFTADGQAGPRGKGRVTAQPPEAGWGPQPQFYVPVRVVLSNCTSFGVCKCRESGNQWASSNLQHTDPGVATSSLFSAENLAGDESPPALEGQSWSLPLPAPQPPQPRDKPRAAWNSPVLGQAVQRFPWPRRSQCMCGM